MSENPTIEITLARSSNREPIELLPYAYSFKPIFNRPGSFDMTIPLDSDAAYQVAKHSTCIVYQRNERVRWSGSIVSVRRDPQAMTLSLSAVGWLDELNHRFVWPSEEPALTFTDVAGGAIVQALIATANAKKDTSGIVRPTHLSFNHYFDTQTRTRSYKRSQNYGQSVQELVDVENGLDIAVDPLTLQVTTSPPTSFVDRTNAVFGYGVEPFNLVNAPQTDDGSATANRVTAVGSNGLVVPADDTAAIDAAGIMLEEWQTLSDVADSAIIGAYANAELVYQRYGKVTYDISPIPYGDDVLRLYDDFELGDRVYLSIQAGALSVDDQPMRIFSVSLDGDVNGNEVVSQIGVTPQ